MLTASKDNHKPNFPTDSTRARLKPSIPGQTGSYDLNFSGNDGRTDYAFAGTRVIGDGRYVLYFDPKREVFVLDRMDSTFHMNITRTPGNSDPEALKQKYPHISGSKEPSASRKAGVAGPSRAAESSSSSSSRPLSKPKQPRAKSPVRKKEPPARKPDKKAAPKPKDVNLALPQAAPAAKSKLKTKSKSRPAEEEDEEEDQGDDLLLVEYPDGGGPKASKRDFSPAFTSVRRFDEYMDQRESEADDADGESESDMDFKLPSPVNNPGAAAAAQHEQEEEEEEEEEEPEFMDVDQPADYGHAQQYDGGEDAESPNLEDDLEKDLEEAFEAVNNSNHGTPADGDESEISEED